jgi:hypothetical protein
VFLIIQVSCRKYNATENIGVDVFLSEMYKLRVFYEVERKADRKLWMIIKLLLFFPDICGNLSEFTKETSYDMNLKKWWREARH